MQKMFSNIDCPALFCIVTPLFSPAHQWHRVGGTKVPLRVWRRFQQNKVANSLWFTCHAALHHLAAAFSCRHYFPACISGFGVCACLQLHCIGRLFSSHDDDEKPRSLVRSREPDRRAGVRPRSAPHPRERWQWHSSRPSRAGASDSHDRRRPSATATPAAQIGGQCAAPDLASLRAGGLSAEVGPGKIPAVRVAVVSGMGVDMFFGGAGYGGDSREPLFVGVSQSY